MSYFDHFSNSFFWNFFFSLIFVFFIFYISLSFEKKNIVLSNYNNLEKANLFYLFFCILFIQLSFFTLFDILKYFYYLFFLEIIVIFFFLRNSLNKIFKVKYNLFILFFFFLYFLISILPLSDADSIAYHLNFPFKLYLNNLDNFDIKRDFEYSQFFGNEIILLLSILFKSDNLGSILNFFSIFLLLFFFPQKKIFFLLVLSAFLTLSFLTSQKMIFFYAILYLVIFIQIHEKRINNNTNLFVIVFLVFFYMSGKLNYLINGSVLLIYLTLNYKNNFSKIFIYSISSFLLILFPLFLIKYKFFGNLLTPFFENYLGKYQFLEIKSLEHMINSFGWRHDNFSFEYFLRSIFPLEIGSFTTSLGIIFIFLLIDFKLHKRTNYIPLILIILTLLMGQYLQRFYLEAYLILAFYTIINNKYLKNLIYVQSGITILFLSLFIFYNYKDILEQNFKDIYQSKNSFSYINAKNINSLNLEENYLNFADGRNSIFYNDKSYSNSYLGMTSNYKKNEVLDNLNTLVKEADLKYMILDQETIFELNCSKEIINEIDIFWARKNFLNKNLKKKFYLIRVQQCKKIR